jgi:microcystin-dependent protein
MTQSPSNPTLQFTSDLGAPTPPVLTVAAVQLIATGGTFPPREGGGGATNAAAMVHILAGANVSAFAAAACSGETLQIERNQPLFSLLGTTYGGDGVTSFDLPDLRGRTTVGNAPGAYATSRTLPMTYMIAAQAPAGSAYPMVGTIGVSAANYASSGWLAADGALLPIYQNVSLFEAIGKTFGGDGVSTFALPDLTGRAAVGIGQGPAGSPVVLGQPIDPSDNAGIAGLGLAYLVNVAGQPAPAQGDGGFPDSVSVLGEVIAFAGAGTPTGWLPANGQMLSVGDYPALFELIGTTYGGDGQESFALPDLRGRIVIGHPQ